MQTVKEFNNISDKLRATIPSLESGQTMTFQMLNGRVNPDEDSKKQNPMLFGKVQLRTNFRVLDKYKTNKEGKEVGGYVDIVLAEDWFDDKPTKSKMFVAGFGDNFFQGKFDLVGGKVEDEELFEILWLSPEREDSPCADRSVRPIFKVLDFKKETEKKTAGIGRLREAIDLAIKLKDDDVANQQILRSLNISMGSPEERQGKIADLAREKPDLLLSAYNDPQKETKAIVKEALESGLLAQDLKGNVTVNGEPLTSVITKDGQELINGLAAFMTNSPNGNDILATLKKQLTEPIMA